MGFNREIQRRHSIRLPGYDYSQPNAYFVTICAFQRECLFGEIVDGEMRLNEIGAMVAKDWLHSAEVRKEIEIDEWVIMPNHFHAIVWIVGAHGNAPSDRPIESAGSVQAHYHAPLRRPRSLSTLLAGFKRISTMNINRIREMVGIPVWQRNYYERIIRTDRELHAIREYIRLNPMKWEDDPENG